MHEPVTFLSPTDENLQRTCEVFAENPIATKAVCATPNQPCSAPALTLASPPATAGTRLSTRKLCIPERENTTLGWWSFGSSSFSKGFCVPGTQALGCQQNPVLNL